MIFDSYVTYHSFKNSGELPLDHEQPFVRFIEYLATELNKVVSYNEYLQSSLDEQRIEINELKSIIENSNVLKSEKTAKKYGV